jgi:hypothetical protein
LAELEKRKRSFEMFNTRILALSVDTPEQSRAVVHEMKLSFDFLCDPDKKVIDLYHLRNPHEHGGIAYPAIFVIAPSGKIHYRTLDGTALRVDPTDVLTFLKKFTEDPESLSTGSPQKKWIIPLWKTMWQISRNMIFRGSMDDWKHYFMFPINLFRASGRQIAGVLKRFH